MTILAWLLLLAAPADDLSELVRQLGDDAVEVRAAAAAKLTAQGRAIVPDLERARAGESDPEVRARIALILKSLTQVRWHTELEPAMRKAAAEKKPLLVFSTLGPLDGFVWLGGHLMRTVTFADPAMVDFLNDKFVVVWNNHNLERSAPGQQSTYGAAEMAAYPEGGGGRNLYTVVAAPDGTVLNSLSGYWSTATLRDELAFSLGLTPANRVERHAARVNDLQAQIAKLDAEHPGEAGKRVKDSPILKKKAALNLLLASHNPESFREARAIDTMLAWFAAHSRTRVFAWG